MALFHDLGTMLLDTTTLFDSTVTASYMSDLKPIATTVLAIFLIWRIIEYLLGSSTKPIANVMIEVLVWAIVWVFAFNGGGYLDSVQKGMNEAFTWAGGGIGFFDNLDNWAIKLQSASETIYKMDSDYFKLQGILAQFIIMLGAFILTVVPFGIIIFTSLGVQILIMMAPFMILSLLFPTIKEMFYNAVGMFVTLLVIVLMISLIQKSLVSKIDYFVNGVTATISAGGDTSITSIAINILILCLIYTLLMYASVPIGKAIGGKVHGMGIGKGDSKTHKDT